MLFSFQFAHAISDSAIAAAVAFEDAIPLIADASGLEVAGGCTKVFTPEGTYVRTFDYYVGGQDRPIRDQFASTIYLILLNSPMLIQLGVMNTKEAGHDGEA